ncbi:MAG: hypothetical protein ACOCV1_08335 [Bacillota bacterium]
MKTDDLFHTSQYVTIKCFKNLCDIQENLEELDMHAANGNLSIIFSNLDILENLIKAMEKNEYSELIENEFDEDKLDEESSESSSSSDSELLKNSKK